MIESGLYLVTLSNVEPISVNANDPRIAERCIRVSHVNCKVGKARCLDARRASYASVFGAGHVNFSVMARTAEFVLAEKLVLKALDPWRIRGATGRKNEWLRGIGAAEVERLAIEALHRGGVGFDPPGRREPVMAASSADRG